MNAINKNDFDLALLDPKLREELSEFSKQADESANKSNQNIIDGSNQENVFMTRNCPSCNSNQYQFLFSIPNMDIIRCQHCNLTYSLQVLDYEIDMQRYSDAPLNTHAETRENRVYQLLQNTKHSYVMQIVNNLISNKPSKNLNFLDVGCANGSLLNKAQESGFNTYGIEPNYSLAIQAEKKHKNIKVGFFPEINFSPIQFDIITAFDVLEHIEKPLEFLNALQNELNSEGLLVIQVPNMNSLLIEIQGASNSNYCYGHWTYFVDSTLQNMLNNAGYSLVHHETIITEIDKIKKYPLEVINLHLKRLVNIELESLDLLTAELLHEYFLGYKLFHIYKKA